MMQFLVLALLAYAASSEHVRYVKPNSSSSCPDQPCLTLDQYATQGTKFFTTGATFLFLAGNHSVHSTVLLQNVSDVALKGERNGYHVTLFCKAQITCKNVTNFTIQGVKFVLYTGNMPAWLSVLNIIDSREVLFLNLTFQDAANTLSAVYINHSHAFITSCFFKGNTGQYGGSIHASNESNITLDGNSFIYNKAHHSGGAIFVNESSLLMKKTLGNSFTHNSAVKGGGVIFSLNSRIDIESDATNNTQTFPMTNDFHPTNFSNEQVWQCSGLMHYVCQLNHNCTAYFSNNKAEYGGAVYLVRSVASLNGIAVIFHNNSAEVGGAIGSTDSTVTTSAKLLCFTGNSAQKRGGAYFGFKGSLQLGEIETNTLHFDSNSAVGSGGAIYFQSGQLNLTGNSLFANNHALSTGNGGAIFIARNSMLFGGTAINFVNNTTNYAAGGGVAIQSSKLVITAKKVSFVNNRAPFAGGGLSVTSSSELQVKKSVQLKFIGNWAWKGGGLQCMNSHCSIVSASYINNTGKFGGGAIAVTRGSLFHHDANITGNSDMAIDLLDANISFSGNVKINKNTGSNGGIRNFDTGGGGIRAMVSFISFTGNTVFEDNYATTNGGAITLLLRTTLSFGGVVLFKNNSAIGNGGAIFATQSTIISNNMITFTSNRAENGGAMYFQNGAAITLKQNATLSTFVNHAAKYGGAIYHSDAIALSQCEQQSALALPSCFIDVVLQISNTHLLLTSVNDSAGNDGSFLYGGLLDKCQILIFNNSVQSKVALDVGLFYHQILMNPNLSTVISKHNTTTKPITSEPYILCFCESNTKYNCSKVKMLETYRGRRFTVSLVVLAQGNSLSSAPLRAKLSPTARLKPSQILQFLPQNCTDISYNLYSSEKQEELILYPDGGSCRDIGVARSTVNATFLPCPDAFVLSGDECICEERLRTYNAECTIFDDKICITRKNESHFWVNPLYTNGIYQGLILYPMCPLGYCKTGSFNISLSQPDIQCDLNRSGVLCGACAANYSLILGSSRCQTCSNTYLALLLLFAAAGIALVVFLTALQLTVATGVINSIILYANIVQANRNLLFPSSTNTNVLTVFIAWMNLDLGFHTCFYHGMDAYTQTWLQFAFPLYVWFLITLIILTSRYSITVTKLIGSNPIAVLATLLLMSYTKILKIIIDVYSSVKLEYPGNVTVTVWLKDANMPYLQSWHLALTVVTTLALSFLFLPYTLLLLLGYKLYRFTGRIKCTHWLIRIKPLLDSYHAPYKIRTRYWSGFLLLVRCALYTVFTFDSVGHLSLSLLAIIIVFTAIIAFLSVQVHTNFYNNAIEALVYLNLVVLSAAASNGANYPYLVNTLVGIVFAIMMVIIFYRFFILYIAKSKMWMKVLTKLPVRKKAKVRCTASEIQPLLPPIANILPQQSVATKSVVSLLEPCTAD